MHDDTLVTLHVHVILCFFIVLIPLQAMSSYSTLLEAAQMIITTRLQILQGREQELQAEVRTLNRQLAEADARNNVRMLS